MCHEDSSFLQSGAKWPSLFAERYRLYASDPRPARVIAPLLLLGTPILLSGLRSRHLSEIKLRCFLAACQTILSILQTCFLLVKNIFVEIQLRRRFSVRQQLLLAVPVVAFLFAVPAVLLLHNHSKAGSKAFPTDPLDARCIFEHLARIDA